MTSDSMSEEMIEGRGTCAFCENPSDFVLELDDSAPEPDKVVQSWIALPICRNHLSDAKEADLNA